jgi:hypothetical protein
VAEDTGDRRFLTWCVRAPGGADGVAFARGRSEVLDRILVHAAPPVIDVEVFDNGERLLASGAHLAAQQDAGPIELLALDGLRVVRSPTRPQDEIGSAVLLAGGEIGRLTGWTFDQGGDRWSWSVRFDGGR